MVIRNEQDLLERLEEAAAAHSCAPEASSGPSAGISSRARFACDQLQNAFEREDAAGRKLAGLAAYRVWKGLPEEVQDEHIRLVSGVWISHFFDGNPDRILRVARCLKRRGDLTSRPSLQAEALFAEGVCLLSQGRVRSAIQVLDLSRALFSSTGRNQADVIRASLPLASALRMDGDHRSGTATLMRARTACLEIENAALLASVSLNLGSILLEEADLEEAEKHYSYVLRSSELLGFAKRAVRGKLGLALTSLRSGRIEKAITLAEQALEESRDLSLQREQSLALEYLALTHSFQRDPSNELSTFRLALRSARRGSTGLDILLELHRYLAEFWVDQGDARKARIHLSKSYASAERASEAEDTLALERIEAEILWLEGRHAEALDALLEHAKVSSDRGFGYEHLLTARRIAMVAADANERGLAEEWWARTEFLAEACGASPLLERWRSDWDRVAWAGMEGGDSSDMTPSPESLAPGEEELPWVDLARYGIITRSKRLEEQASWISRLAPTKVPVLIRGQSGTGKELYAHLVHALSPRKAHPFLAINCGALPAEIIESELFGHRRGAFTGAVVDKPGLFREAHRGTLFLDEIGEMPGSAQAKLLRVLETGEVRPVGGVRYETVDVRIVAATNVDLEKAVRDGRFRKDLYYRLKGLEIELPPLRERLADIPPLAQHFLRLSSTSQQKKLEFPFDTIQWLMGQPWPGNVRELKLAVERAVAMAPSSGMVLPRHFIGITGADEISSLPEELEEIERARVENALEANDWNTAAAARLLGMSRTTLGGRMKKLGIRKPRPR